MAQPPVPGRDAGAEPGRDRGLPGGRDARLAAFADGGAGDRFAPGGWLAMTLDDLSGPDRRCFGATDDELIGLIGRWSAVESWSAAGKLGLIGELIRRRARPGHEDRALGGMPTAWHEGLGHELAQALAVSLPGADKLAALAWALQARLPGIAAKLADGTIDMIKARIIADELSVLDDALATQAEALILDELAGKTPGQIARLAADAVLAVDPEGAQKRREQAERDNARIRFWREQAGTAALAGFGLPTDAALAANANIDVRARQYKKAKLDGTMGQLRVLAYLDILNGITADQRIAQASAATQTQSQTQPQPQPQPQPRQARPAQAQGDPAGGAAPDDSGGPAGSAAPDGTMPGRQNGPVPGRQDGPADGAAGATADVPGTGDSADGNDPADDGPSPADDGPAYEWLTDNGPWDDEDSDDGSSGDGDLDADGAEDDESGGAGTGGPGRGDGPGSGPGAAPDAGDAGPVLAASTNLTIPLATVQSLADRPGHGHGLGPLDPALARDLAAAAARSPHSQFCVTVTSPEGYAIGHGCARPAKGNRSKSGSSRDGPWSFTMTDDPGPPGGYGTWTLTLPDGRELTVKLGPIPVTDCDHRYESHGYQPSDTLRHLVQVRDGQCTFPACSRHARESDFEHALPYDQGGRTCACNAGARSRRCHKVKQSNGWSVTQPLPGWHQWRTPSGRSYTQGPMKYPA